MSFEWILAGLIACLLIQILPFIFNFSVPCINELVWIKRTRAKITVFWNVTPYSLINRYQRFGERFTFILLEEEEGTRSSETLIFIYQTTRCHTQEDNNLHSYRYENLRSRKSIFETKPTRETPQNRRHDINICATSTGENLNTSRIQSLKPKENNEKYSRTL
jgi:hypothetical protein